MERLAQKLPQGGYKAKVDPFSVLERLGRLEDLSFFQTLLTVTDTVLVGVVVDGVVTFCAAKAGKPV